MSDTLRVSNLHFGLNTSNYNQPQMGFTSVGAGSTANYGFLQFFGTSNTLCWTANGTVGIGSATPSYTLDVVGSARISGSIFSSSVSVTFTGTFTNIFTCSTNRCYLLTMADNGPDGTYGVFLLIPTQNTITTLSGNNIILQFSGLTVQARSSNSVSYTKTCNVIQLS